MAQPPAASGDARWQALLDERRDAFELLTASDAMLGLVHDINDNLNSMMLQASIVEMKVDDSLRDDVALIRRLGNDVAAVLARVYQFRDRFRKSRAQVDLNQAVREVLSLDPDQSRRFLAVLADRPLPLLVNAAALKRLIRLLLTVVDAGQPSTDVALKIRTQLTNEDTRLILEPAGGSEESRAGWDAIPEREDGCVPVMERLAAEALARLVGASLSARQGPGGDLSVAASWPRDSAAGAAVD